MGLAIRSGPFATYAGGSVFFGHKGCPGSVILSGHEAQKGENDFRIMPPTVTNCGIFAMPQKSLFDLTKGVLLANCIFVAKQGADHENPQSIISDFAHDFHVRTESLPAV